MATFMGCLMFYSTQMRNHMMITTSTTLQLILLFVIIQNTLASESRKNSSLETNEPQFPPPQYHKNFPFNERGHTNDSIHTGFVLWLESVTKIDVSIMEFEVYGYVVQEWTDRRLNGIFSSPFILREPEKIWLPDVYCVNCRESTMSNPQNQNSMIRIGGSGDVYYSQGVRLSASCPMNLKSFPFDKQRCTVQFASYSYNTSFLQYFWNGPVVLTNHELDQFKVQKVTTSQAMANYKSGKYSILKAEFLFVRRMGFYVIQVYLPTAMLVSLSWITFYMDPVDIGDRLTIGITLILTMIFMLGYINTSLPKVSYIKAVDWYLIISLILIILGVVEGVIAYGLHFKYTKRKEKKEKDKSSTKFVNGTDGNDFALIRMDSMRHRGSTKSDKIEEMQLSDQHDATKELLQTEAANNNLSAKRSRCPLRCFRKKRTCRVPACYQIVDSCSKLLFPLIFIGYNVLYFWMYHKEQWQE